MALSGSSSSLSTAVSVPSSDGFSYCTAAPSPTAGDDEVTNLSSPAEAVVTPYRAAKQLPDELKNHVRIWLEEKMYLDAIQLLDSLLAPGGSRDSATVTAACVPPGNLLAVLNTLAIHPDNTNRPAEQKSGLVGTRAMHYLRSLLTAVGPLNANLRLAFLFKEKSRGGRHCYGADADSSGDEYLDSDDGLRCKYANTDAIWTRGQDFWKVAGWAFNCSVLHPNRWRYWRPWLEYMIDVLEQDFEERKRLDAEAYERDGNPNDFDHPMLKESLIRAYADKINRLELRNMMKALLADGSQSSIALFPEVFPRRETKSASRTTNKRKRDDLVLDLENDKFGDYCDDSSPPSSQGSEPPAQPQPTARGRKKAAAKSQSSSTISPGFAESIHLRLRLFHLLALSFDMLGLPNHLFDIYDLFCDGLRDLPVPVFALYVSSTSSPLPVNSLCSFLKFILGNYLPSKAPKPDSVDKEAADDDGASVEMLKHCYLPFAANTVTADANAKMSLLLESLFRLVWVIGGVPWSESLQLAVESGVRLRNEKAKPRKVARANIDGEEDAARASLANSGQRLLTMMRIIEWDDDKGNGS